MSLLSIVFNIVRHFYSSRRFSSLIGRQKHPITLRLYYDCIYAFTLCVKMFQDFCMAEVGIDPTATGRLLQQIKPAP